jgi:hypothetical protein
MRSGEHFEYSISYTFLTSFLNGFCGIIACWKGLELRNSYTLQDITIGKALRVIAYKIKNMCQKCAKFHRISKPLLGRNKKF